MRLINVKAFLQREQLFRQGKRVDRRAKVLEFGDDELTEYAILSHRWIEQEVDYNEIVKLAKMDEKERSEIRQRDGYRKIIQSCKQAKKDGYMWLWVDTCCIDKRSSAELSEAINSMYRWYENAMVCYTYLHDVSGSSLPTARNMKKYANSDGWPEWFSRGWTLQEMIAPRDVQFFNKHWHPIGNKRALLRILQNITRVPQDVLKDGLSSSRPCVAQIMSWAANRTTTRVEDWAYSLMGLLDVNMPMLYGEGKKAFHRLQLEIIRVSNDQSIFAWSCNEKMVQTWSILADDPSFFRKCDRMELMNRDEFVEYLKQHMRAAELPLTEDDRLGIFPVTNRGIQIWLLLYPHVDSDSVFNAVLPCRPDPSSSPLAIKVALWESNYYRYGNGDRATRAYGPGPVGHPHLRQVYLRYQGTPHCSSTFEIDDSAVHKECVTDTYPEKVITGNTVTLSTTDPLCLKSYSCGSPQYDFEVAFGQYFGQHWIRVIDWGIFYCDIRISYAQTLNRAPEHAQSTNKASSGAASRRVWVMETPLGPGSMILQTSRVMWKSSRVCGVKLEVFRPPRLGIASGKWIGFDVDGTDDPDRDWRGLMIRYYPRKLYSRELFVDGVSMTFLCASKDTKLGDYGHFNDSEYFCCEGNLFADLRSLSLEADITPRQPKISEWGQWQDLESDITTVSRGYPLRQSESYKLLGLSLPSNDEFKSLLVSFSTRLTNRYLVACVVEDTPAPGWLHLRRTSYEYNFAKPFVWHRNQDADVWLGKS